MLRKTVKKIAALGTGATMVGASILGASAVDLSEYPAPFVEDGKFNALIVVGDEAASSDVIGSVDVATSLQFASRVRKTVSGSGATSVSVEGDAWRVGTSTKEYELSENGGGTETIRSIQSFIDEEELGALSDQTFENDEGSFDYEQFLHWDNPTTTYVHYVENDDDVTDAFFYVGSGDTIARYELDFKQSAESDVTDSSGDASTTGAYLWDFENEEITMLGRTFTIVQARRTGGTTNNAVKLTLMAGAVRDVLDEGESKTYTIDGTDYDVTLDFVGTSTAKLNVNGEVTDSLSEGSTEKLSDGTEVGIRDILAQDFAGGVRKVEFYLGAQKVVLHDTNTAVSTDGEKPLEVGSENIDDATVTIIGTDDNTTVRIDSIHINSTADDDIYVGAGETVSQHMEEPEALLEAWDIEYQGLADAETEMIRVKTNGDRKYELQFADGSGNEVDLPLLYASAASSSKLGDNDDDTIINENQTISDDDYFVLCDESQSDGERRTYAFRYRGSDKSSADNPVIKFQDLGSGQVIERSYSAAADAAGAGGTVFGSADATIKVGGQTYNVHNVSSDLVADFDIAINLDASSAHSYNVSGGGAAGDVVCINTNAGAKIELSGAQTWNIGAGANSLLVNVTTPDADDYDDLAPSSIAYTLSTDSSTEVSAASAVGLTTITPQDEDDVEKFFTSLGTFVTFETPSSAPETVDIEYPRTQRLPLLFVTAGAVETSVETTEEGDIVYYDTEAIEVGSAKLASEVSDVRAQHVILVGGPCANPAAADVMGTTSATCAEGFEEGKGKLKLFEHTNGNVALLVAGYSALDTRRSARVLADFDAYEDTLQGTEVEVSGTSFTDITVAAPEVMEEEEEVMEETEDDGEAMEDEGEAEEGGEESES